ncbi:GTP pyrophosphokinase family protein [Paenibacillus pasadenensis]|uniref:GTP pyrophosphokinase n=1 Tax=Paenibacillus pasadenensis TaxID=217090 RepID=UPI00203E9829|nr:GTP pyrophosphokinase family protein [Paenibacillus pasadenensis]MCM3749646.1 GTP pyrophosphokinase family protein [Paenibacillus pasadenensis]
MNSPQLLQLKRLKNEITRFMMMYKFALDEMETKIEILKEEFQLLHDYNPIEHTKSRVKSPESIINKIARKNGELSLPSIKETIKDIAGLRITCSFVSDIYRIHEMLKVQHDLRIIDVKDYIANPKANGYQSLHLLVEVPVFMSDRAEKVLVEVQIRTIAMDFWASLEHKLYYKYNKAVPEHLLRELKEAADSAAALDIKMERLHREVESLQNEEEEETESYLPALLDDGRGNKSDVPSQLLRLLGDFSS